MTRILFVDDDPLVLDTLRLTVRVLNREWEACFAASGEEALELLARTSCDVVVSDLRMPEMSGAQLLNEVMRLYPGTVRMILSGYAEQEMVLRCVGTAHQFLTKPLALPALKKLLDRVTTLRKRLHAEEIRRLVGQKGSLPSIPKVYFEIQNALAEPNCSVERIGQIVATDAGLTTKLLQLVNSAFFGIAHEVSNAEEATMLLGTGTIRSLALTLNLFSAFKTAPVENFSLEQIWAHSLRVARLAKRIVTLEGGDDNLADQAFTAGLLHDVGKLLLSDNPSVHYLELVVRSRKENRPLLERETQAFQTNHAEVGAYLLDLWGLPLPLVEAVAWHHTPLEAGAPVFNALTAVHAANVLEQQTSPHAPNAALSQLDQPYLQQLKLENRVEAWRKALASL